MCRTATGAVSTKPFCGNLSSATGSNIVAIGVCGQCQVEESGGGGPSDCTSSSGTCAKGSCESGEICCQSGACASSQANCWYFKVLFSLNVNCAKKISMLSLNKKI